MGVEAFGPEATVEDFDDASSFGLPGCEKSSVTARW